ncbi:MAG: M20/M25/M40 family metallo-hydrolase [Candidatus Bathyarchaeota archaeon]|nr:MAG: M20/M25/M40 family metallo-hydrolase [Candidatus Bathyarchaeota archaeon]
MVLTRPKSPDIQALYQGPEAFKHIEALTSFGPRVAGGPAEKAAADYIAGQMENYELIVEIEQFPVTYFEDLGATLEIIDGAALSPNILHFSPSGEFTAEIVNCGLGFPEDCTPDVAGNIALIQRGELLFWQKTQNAAAAGAIAVVIYNSEPGNFMATLTFVTDIPAISVSLENGTLLLDLLEITSVTVHLNVETVISESTSQNIIGTLEGTDPDPSILYLGAHYDSVSVGLGANDDASGVAAMLEAARVLSTKVQQVKTTLKFIAFGAEETGLEGSENYVMKHEAEVRNKGLGMINLDMIAVGETLLIGSMGLAESSLVNYTSDKAAAMDIYWQPFAPEARGDHAPFETVGVPVVFLYQIHDPWYHTAEDTPDKIDIVTLEINGELATTVMYEWA